MVSLSAPIGHPETRALLCTSVQRGGRSVRYKRLQEKSKLHPLHSLVESAGTGRHARQRCGAGERSVWLQAELAAEPIHPARARDLAGRSARHSLEHLMARLRFYARSLSRSRTIR
jgi:hypothetical protein